MNFTADIDAKCVLKQVTPITDSMEQFYIYNISVRFYTFYLISSFLV